VDEIGPVPLDAGAAFAAAFTGVAVLDPDYRLPDHPAHGTARPARADNHGEPTDPAVLAEVRSLLDEFTAEHTRLRGAPPDLAPGHSEAEILAAETRLGVRLPEDLRAVYRLIHDDVGRSGPLGRFSPVPLEQVVAWYHEDGPGSYGWNDGLFENTPVVFETHPRGHVRRVSRSDAWVTFAVDLGMNYAAVDLDPAGGGEYGQVLMYGRDTHGPVVHVASSVRSLMRAVVESMRGAATGSGWYWHQPEPPKHEWIVDLDGADPAALVSTMDDPTVVQLAHLRRADRVRLSDLAGLPNLRAIRVLDARQKATEVDLTLPSGPPVEQVDVTAERFDPRRLAATPGLRYVTLAGNSTPVGIAALAALPGLVRLDLAGAVVTDVAAVATFPALRVLTLGAAQWRDLLGTGRRPDRLAAARLGGPYDAAESAAWQRAIRGAGDA
jgi:cell wall assembly regulator SMI1